MRAFAPFLLGLALLAPRGGAAPCTRALDDLAAEVEQRAYLVLFPTTPEQKAEKKGLARVRRALRFRSTSFRKDAATAGLAGRTLLDLYPGQGTVEDIVQGALDGLRDDLALEREDLLLTAGRLPGGDLRDRALEGAAVAADALDLDAAADPLAVEDRADALGAAALALAKGFRRALPGADGRRRRTCGDEMWAVEEGGLAWRADQVVAIYNAASDSFLLRGVRARRPAEHSELELVVTGVTGVGTYPLEFGTGKWVETFTQYGIVEGGTLTVTDLDLEAGTIEGTFAFTARGCVFDCTTYEVTGGKFRLRNLQVP